MNKLKLCLVGVGSIGRRHLRLLNERDDVILSVVEPFEPSWQRIVDEVGTFERFASLDEALAAGNIDAVIISTPHGMHAKMAIQALEAGVHVFCEKPMSDDLTECVAMLKAAQKTDKVFSVGFMFHFDPFVRKVKEIVASGRLGKVLHYYSRFATYNTLLCSLTKHQANTPYSLVMDCIHDSDLLCWITGRVPDYAYSNAFHAGDMELSSPQNFIDTTYRWEGADMGAHVHFNYVQHPQIHVMEIVGDKGYIRGDFMTAEVEVGTIDGKKEIIDASRNFEDVYRAEWDCFVKACRGECEAENPAESAIMATLLMQAQKESGTTGKEINIHELAARCGFEY